MFLVVNFSLIVFVMLLLAQKSNIAVPAQIISAMVVTTLPLILSVMWAGHSDEQKNANAKKLEIKLEKIIEKKLKTVNVVTVEVKATVKIKETNIIKKMSLWSDI